MERLNTKPPIQRIPSLSGEAEVERYSTNAAQLLDLQCQLKQLRFSEVVEFLANNLRLRYNISQTSGTFQTDDDWIGIPPGVEFDPDDISNVISRMTEATSIRDVYFGRWAENKATASDFLRLSEIVYTAMRTFSKGVDIKLLQAKTYRFQTMLFHF